MPARRPVFVIAGAALAAPGIAFGQSAAISGGPGAPGVVSVATGVDDLALLTGNLADEAARFESAKRLVLKTDEATSAALSRLLRGEGSAEAQRAVARAISAVDPGSPRFALALREGLLHTPNASVATDILGALNDYPLRPVVRAVMTRLTDPAAPAEMRTVLLDALLRWTGCEPCAVRGVTGWHEWWMRTESLDDGAWNGELAQNFRARAERLDARAEALAARVVDLYTSLYTATAPDRRGDVIAAMLRDDVAGAQRLGLDLASRTLLNAQPLGEPVAAAAMCLLSSGDEETRVSAARLIENLNPPDSANALREALVRERSPRVAAPLIRLLSRTKGALPVATALRWLRAGEPASSASSEALLVLVSAGELPDDAVDEVRSTLRDVEPESVTAAQSRLLGAVSDERSAGILRRVAERATSRGARRAAASALARYPENTDYLLEGVAAHPEWIEGVAAAVRAHRPTASAFLQMVATTTGDESWVAPASQTLAALPGDQRLTALRAIADGAKRDALINATLGLLDPAGAREALLLQAEARLEGGDAEGALASANAALDGMGGVSPRGERARFFALVSLNRLPEALAATPGEPAEFWTQALRRCEHLPHAGAILALIDENFGPSMTPDQRAAADAIRTALAGRAAAGTGGGQ